MQLSEFIYQIDALDSKTVSQLSEIVAGADFSEDWLRSLVPHSLPSDRYTRKLLHQGRDYEIVVAIWPRGTLTLPHDHGAHDSHGVVKVLQGEVFNHAFQRLPCGGISSRERHVFGAGELIQVTEGLVHRMGNGGGQLALSLHVYSPWIIDVTYWDPASLKQLQTSA